MLNLTATARRRAALLATAATYATIALVGAFMALALAFVAFVAIAQPPANSATATAMAQCLVGLLLLSGGGALLAGALGNAGRG